MAKPRGNPKLKEIRNSDVTAANLQRTKVADEHAMEIGRALYDAMEEHGTGKSKQFYADWLNDHGFKTSRGGAWSVKQVGRVFNRLRKSQLPSSLFQTISR